MQHLVVPHHGAVAPLLEVADDAGVALVDDVLARVIGHGRGEAPGLVDRHHDRDAGRLAGREIVLAEARRHMDDAGAVLRRDEVAAKHPEGVLGVLEIGEQRLVAAPDQLGARESRAPPRRRGTRAGSARAPLSAMIQYSPSRSTAT